MRLKLQIPTFEDEMEVILFKKEFFNNEELVIHGDGGLDKNNSYSEWLKEINLATNKITCPSHLVPATTYIAKRIKDEKIVGIIQIRHYLNELLLSHGGHIGYSIRPSERRKGYAKEMLKLALNICHELNIEKVLITCLKENTASKMTILANQGILENEVSIEDEIYQRYWINLKR